MNPSTLIPSPASTDLLMGLLDDELRFSPSFRGIYSNHLPMALVALHQLDAPHDVLQHVFDRHVAGESEPRDDHDDLRAVRREVAMGGIAAAVRDRVPALVRGPSTALFHPLIRLAYGLDVGHEGQVAAALLDWQRRFHVLPLPGTEPGGRRLRDVAADVAARSGGRWRATFDLDGVARRPELAASLDGLALDDRTLDDVSAFALAAHVTAEAFVTLHLVTGARAVRAVAGWVDDDVARQLAAHTAQAMAVAYAAIGAPPLLGSDRLDDLRRLPLPSADAIAERAIADLDPHVVKLSNVALVEEARTGDPLYRYAAARVVDLVPAVRA
jgi:hypothetical protein